MNLKLLSALAFAVLANVTFAAQSGGIPMPSPLTPVPDPSFSQYNGAPVVVSAQPAELFSDVRYHGTRNIAPCAVPTVVQVTDPCAKRSCCKSCVNVQICVPPCDPTCVKVTRDGNHVRYEYGKYSVVVKTVGHHVVVHYGD